MIHENWATERTERSILPVRVGSQAGRKEAAIISVSRQSMAVFAEHIGVAESTVRAMEHGSAAVRIGTWVRAVHALERESRVAALIAHDLEQFESTDENNQRLRKRAPRRRVTPASRA